MANICELTGKRPETGNLVSHSNIKTRTRWLPNLRSKRYLIPELGQIMSLRLSTHAIRTIDKVGGISRAILNAKEDQLSERLLKVKRSLVKKAKA
jgi:large subunit ribosomal protein L28